MSAEFEVIMGISTSDMTDNLCHRVLQEANDNPDKKYIFMVPEQSGNAYEKRLIRMNESIFGRPGFFNIDVIGFNRLAYKVFDEMGIRSTEVFEEYEKNMLIRVACGKLVKELRVYGKSINKVGFISEIKTLVSELISFGITPEEFEEVINGLSDGNASLAAKLNDVLLIYKEYADCFDDMYMELSEGRLKLLLRLLKSEKSCDITDGTVFVFDEFRRYSPDQLNVIEALAERAEVMIYSICMDKETIDNNYKVKDYNIFRQSVEAMRDLQKAHGIKPKITCIDNNSDGTGSSAVSPNMLTHLRDHIFRYPVVEYHDELKDELQIFSTNGPEEEIRVVAELIRDEIKSGYRYEDMVIVTGDTEGFDRYASGIFKEYDIPIFCDYNRRLRKNPYTEAILRMLRIVDYEYDYDSIFGFIKTGVWKSDSDVIYSLENYVLRTGMRGHKIWSKEIKPYGKNVSEEELQFYADTDAVRRDFMELMEPLYMASRGKNSVSSYINALRTIIGRLDFENSIESSRVFLENEKLYSDALVMKGLYSIIEKALDQTESLLGKEMMSIHDFIEILSSGISEIEIGIIPPTIDSVHVCDLSRSRILSAKIIHFISMNDGIIPAPAKTERIVTDRDRKTISEGLAGLGNGKMISKTNVEKKLEDLFDIYQILSRATDKLTLSYYKIDEEGADAEPSFIIGRIGRMYPGLETVAREPESFRGTEKSDRLAYIGWLRDALDDLHAGDTGERYTDNLSRIVRYAGYSEDENIWDSNVYAGLGFSNKAGSISENILDNINLRLSVSKMEKYATCPYSFFLKYILGLNERKERRIELYEIGNIIHAALEFSLKDIKKNHDSKWDSISDEKLKDIMSAYLQAAWSEYKVQKKLDEEESGKLDLIYHNLETLSDRTIITLKNHILSGKMLPERMEQSFSATLNLKRKDGRELPVVIQGKIDRLDSYEDESGMYIRVVDYKTGSQDFKLQEIKEGTAVQLSLYTKIVSEILRNKLDDKNIIPAGMYYYHVDDPVISPGSDNSYSWDEVKIEESLNKEIKKDLKLRGITYAEPESLIGLHDEKIIDEDGNVIGDSDVIPVSIKKKEGIISPNSLITDKKGFEGICDYSTVVLEDTAENIFSGCFDKRPIVYSGKHKPCEYCEYVSVCRFNEAAGKEKKVKTDGRLLSEQIEELIKLTEDREKPEIKRASFYDPEER